MEGNELILMRIYTTRNYLTAKSFIKEVLNYCENKPKFIIDIIQTRNLSISVVWLNLSLALSNTVLNYSSALLAVITLSETGIYSANSLSSTIIILGGYVDRAQKL
ncbi:MAG: IS6 family transposase [Archaeoglobaceae archaeon]|nr:IS6 family transposase [Archaeoglobaceae archaeon]